MAARTDRLAREATAASRGLARTNALVAVGLHRSTIARRVATGVWARPHHGVIDVTRQEMDWSRRVLAVVLANPEGTVASHGTAAALHDLPGFGRQGRIEVTTPRPGRMSSVPHTVHSSVRPDPHVTTIEAVPCAGPVRTLVGLATGVPDRVLARAAREALRRGLVTVDDVRDEHLDHLPGTRRLRRVVAREHEAALLSQESPLEGDVIDRLLRLLWLPPFTTQFVLDVDGRRLRPDIAWPEHRVLLEVDGGRWHADHLAAAADDERQRLLEAAGWTVLRVSVADLTSDEAWQRVARRLRHALSA